MDNIKTVELIKGEDGDWEVLKINGNIYFEGHSIHTDSWLEILQDLGVEVSERWLDQKAMENGDYN